jgi:ribosomal protein S18 acetylase RimI-like enzyme
LNKRGVVASKKPWRLAMLSCANAAADLFQRHRDELGFVNRAQCEEKDLVTVKRNGRIVGALLGNHCVRKPQSSVYELAVADDYRRQGIATTLVTRFATESPHDTLIAKCPTELPANRFYRSDGWTVQGTNPGKNRTLNVWEKDTSEFVKFYMTVKGGADLANAVNESAGFAGTESSHEWPVLYSAEFVDYPFTNPEATFDDHVSVVKEHQPRLTVAPDVENGRALADVVAMADELGKYAETVIIVPKECHPSEIPDRHRVGLTVGTFGSMAPWSVWEYRDCGEVHILGGTPNQQLALQGMVDVSSMDSFTLGKRAQYGVWDGVAIDAPEGMDYYGRLTYSIDNYVKAWSKP